MLCSWPTSPQATTPPSPPPPPSPAPSFQPATSPLTVPPSAGTSSASKHSNRLAMSRHVRIAVVGDVHDDWDLEEDAKALQFLQADLVLFTGDFGNENVDLVRSIANLNLPKAAILGNHDSWHTSRFSRKKADRVQLQLEWYGVHDMEGSARKIFGAAVGIPEGHSLILLAHNGPTGLGDKMNDICGRDWVYGGGDHGDPDLAQAIADLKRNTQISMPLVVFGHMHKQLAHRNGLRKMIVVGDDDTVYLNGAVVPRVKTLDPQGSTSGTPHGKIEGMNSNAGTLRAFTLVECLDGKLQKVSETWVSLHNKETAIAEEILLFKRD
ncbi:hypothetical protein Taro_030231 [Colocasia esculenta]|uniref:Calcineurin-like phosphoesterase domain-containing protein n=1 Tax=Colocasia esculenta TaxID=4460 RepID=A0A843W2Q9_COLES|nr:hypothetical protein [Colocasia esculenta]